MIRFPTGVGGIPPGAASPTFTTPKPDPLRP
jgi:hypothetical protein